jgi:hypothetical protein
MRPVILRAFCRTQSIDDSVAHTDWGWSPREAMVADMLAHLRPQVQAAREALAALRYEKV